MAKQIYIDENGNEQLVSGTINNASLLPISASDSTNTKDYIDSVVESGSNANGYYIKYADGTMICTKQITVGVRGSEFNAWGSCYEGPFCALGSWAETFIATPVCNVSGGGGGVWLCNYRDYSATSCGQVRVIRPTTASDMSIEFNVIGIGRWKA